jgi:hypothetical protein
MKDINQELEDEIKVIVNNEISAEKFNEFSINFYLLTNKLLVSLNKFLKLRSIQNPKILQIKNIGQLLYESKDSIKISDLLKSHGYNAMPQLTPQLAYYVVKKNKFTREENWENIIKVIKYKLNPSKVLSEKNLFLSEDQKLMIKNEVKERLNLQEHEISWIINIMNNLKEIDSDLHERFKTSI